MSKPSVALVANIFIGVSIVLCKTSILHPLKHALLFFATLLFAKGIKGNCKTDQQFILYICHSVSGVCAGVFLSLIFIGQYTNVFCAFSLGLFVLFVSVGRAVTRDSGFNIR